MNRRAPRSIPVIEMVGSARRRGEAHGEQAGQLIADTADRWKEDAAVRVGGRVEDYLEYLVTASGFRKAAESFAPELVVEVDAVAAASGVDGRVIWALNLLDEDWWMARRFAGAPRSQHCSGFAVAAAKGQVGLLGQNMDLPGWLDGLQVVLDIRPAQGPAVIAPSYPGMCATNAVNEHGLGVCVNTLASLPTTERGLPVSFFIRLLAQAEGLDAAGDVVTDRPHASGQNYIVADRSGVSDFECSASGSHRLPSSERITHTNHPLGLDAACSSIGSWVDNSEQRLEHLSARLGALPTVTWRDASRFLAEPPVCRGHAGDTGFTFYSVIMELEEEPIMHLSPGPPDRYEYVSFRPGAGVDRRLMAGA